MARSQDAKLSGRVIESQHFEHQHEVKDHQRDALLASQRLTVLRFHNGQVLQRLKALLRLSTNTSRRN